MHLHLPSHSLPSHSLPSSVFLVRTAGYAALSAYNEAAAASTNRLSTDCHGSGENKLLIWIRGRSRGQKEIKKGGFGIKLELKCQRVDFSQHPVVSVGNALGLVGVTGPIATQAAQHSG